MASWAGFEVEGPDLAAAIRARFDAHKHHILATLRADGSPRLTGLEVTFSDGQLWLAMMPDSRKADDLRRDSRFALHAAPIDLEMSAGDAKVSGRAVEVDDEATLRRFLGTLPQEPPESGVGLFRTDLAEASLVRVEGDELVIAAWRAGSSAREIRRK